MTAQLLTFLPFHLNVPDASLWRGKKKVPLPPKEFALLHHLVTYAGQLVTADTLLHTVWPGVAVSPGVLKVRIRQIRHALGDDADKPRFIETVHGRGYRFIATVQSREDSQNTKAGTGARWLEVGPSPQALRLKPQVSNFVGREKEVATLTAALAEAQAGHGRVVFLAGEPGIGKTRTASEVATYAQQRGVLALVGRCHETQGAPPFWPWSQIVRTYIAHYATAALKAKLKTSWRDLAQLLPDAQPDNATLNGLSALESAQTRFRFFESFIAFLRVATATQPLVVILDDLHWADTPSLLLLQFLAHELSTLPLLLIGTYRTPALSPEHPLTQTLGEIARTPASQTLTLQGIGEQEVSRLIELMVGQIPSATITAAILQHTAGNPFFVTELVHTLQEREQLTQPASSLEPSLPLQQFPEGREPQEGGQERRWLFVNPHVTLPR